MHPADKEEFDKINQDRADLRKLLNDTKEELRRMREKVKAYRREIKKLSDFYESDFDG
jgi:septal ring factor EnvC (AmiA/AmiB activator)